MGHTRRQMNADERSVLRSVERICGNLSAGSNSGRTYIVREPEVSVRKIRDALGMSQSEFASKFGMSIKTVRNWEQGISTPEGASRAYLLVIKHNPEAVLTALEDEGPQVVEVHSEVSA